MEERIAALENHVKGLIASVQQLTGVVNVLDQYMLLNKRFFDQIKINEPVQPEVKPEEKK
jgi:hypothetical protein